MEIIIFFFPQCENISLLESIVIHEFKLTIAVSLQEYHFMVRFERSHEPHVTENETLQTFKSIKQHQQYMDRHYSAVSTLTRFRHLFLHSTVVEAAVNTDCKTNSK